METKILALTFTASIAAMVLCGWVIYHAGGVKPLLGALAMAAQASTLAMLIEEITRPNAWYFYKGGKR